MSTLNVDKVDPSSGTALELGTSGDTITVPTGAGLTVTDEVKTNKVSPATGTAFALGDSGDTFTVPSGATIVNSGTATGFGITQTSFLPNAQSMIINGDMQVAQRSSSVTGVTATSGYKTCDRWYMRSDGNQAFTLTQSALTSGDAFTDGFSKSFKWDCTTADVSVSASDRIWFTYKFEGQNVQLLKKGTANAEKITVSFWIKATKTGTNILELWDENNSRHISAAYTVSSTDTWEYKIVNFAADTTGTMNNNSTEGLYLQFWFGAGSQYTGGASLQTTWVAYDSGTTRDKRAYGQINNADSTSNNFEITGVQFEVGEYVTADLPPFRHESYGDNLSRCQRYCYAQVQGSSLPVCSGQMWTTAIFVGNLDFPVTMRAAPTVVAANGTNYWKILSGGSEDSCDAYSINRVGTTGAAIEIQTNLSLGTQGYGAHARTAHASAEAIFDAEFS
mgnify:CR=1 FL=1|tara:strand:+ start:8 stop:1354 length:1347 start_codon:yes stop_codon:yes gene_type:complete